jgi:hypothetical protein
LLQSPQSFFIFLLLNFRIRSALFFFLVLQVTAEQMQKAAALRTRYREAMAQSLSQGVVMLLPTLATYPVMLDAPKEVRSKLIHSIV